MKKKYNNIIYAIVLIISLLIAIFLIKYLYSTSIFVSEGFNNNINNDKNKNLIEHNIFCFWTGDNKMSFNRLESLENLKKVSECNVILVTKSEIPKYILKEEPLHPAFEYLSETHKADYLRTYFMHFYGGGYSDIKKTTGSWKNAFDNLLKSDDIWMVGYKEVNGGVAYQPLAKEWKKLIGNGAYICKPQTPLTKEWYLEMIRLLDSKLELLRKNPAKNPQDSADNKSVSKYPIEWNEMLGRIFHRVSYKYKEKLSQELPISIFKDYR
jgi:hypothetical protein